MASPPPLSFLPMGIGEQRCGRLALVSFYLGVAPSWRRPARRRLILATLSLGDAFSWRRFPLATLPLGDASPWHYLPLALPHLGDALR